MGRVDLVVRLECEESKPGRIENAQRSWMARTLRRHMTLIPDIRYTERVGHRVGMCESSRQIPKVLVGLYRRIDMQTDSVYNYHHCPRISR